MWMILNLLLLSLVAVVVPVVNGQSVCYPTDNTMFAMNGYASNITISQGRSTNGIDGNFSQVPDGNYVAVMTAARPLGSVFLNQPFALNTDWSVKLTYHLSSCSDCYGDGFTFVMLPSSNLTFLGWRGYSMGYRGKFPGESLAFEFDTYHECGQNKILLRTVRRYPSGIADILNITEIPRFPCQSLNSIIITNTPTSIKLQIELSTSSSINVELPIIIQQYLTLINGTDGYFGMTGAGAGALMNVVITEFCVTEGTEEFPIETPDYTYPKIYPPEFISNGLYLAGSPSFSILTQQQEEACEGNNRAKIRNFTEMKSLFENVDYNFFVGVYRDYTINQFRWVVDNLPLRTGFWELTSETGEANLVGDIWNKKLSGISENENGDYFQPYAACRLPEYDYDYITCTCNPTPQYSRICDSEKVSNCPTNNFISKPDCDCYSFCYGGKCDGNTLTNPQFLTENNQTINYDISINTNTSLVSNSGPVNIVVNGNFSILSPELLMSSDVNLNVSSLFISNTILKVIFTNNTNEIKIHYNNITGKFIDITSNNITECSRVTQSYTQTTLTIAFQIQSCSFFTITNIIIVVVSAVVAVGIITVVGLVIRKYSNDRQMKSLRGTASHH